MFDSGTIMKFEIEMEAVHMNRRILIIIPAYNEQDNIISVVERLKQSVPQADYLIVDDCSNDGTAGICKSQGYHYLSLPINLGIGGGVQAEYKYALQNGYDIAVQHDGDGQHDPRYINAAIAPITDGSADIVIGSRFLVQGGGGVPVHSGKKDGDPDAERAGPLLLRHAGERCDKRVSRGRQGIHPVLRTGISVRLSGTGSNCLCEPKRCQDP